MKSEMNMAAFCDLTCKDVHGLLLNEKAGFKAAPAVWSHLGETYIAYMFLYASESLQTLKC